MENDNKSSMRFADEDELKRFMGHQLSLIRKEKHLKQRDLADRLNVSRATVSSWETGKNPIDHFHLLELTRIFKMPLSYFYAYDQGTSMFLNHLFLLCRDVPEEQRKYYLAVFRLLKRYSFNVQNASALIQGIQQTLNACLEAELDAQNEAEIEELEQSYPDPSPEEIEEEFSRHEEDLRMLGVTPEQEQQEAEAFEQAMAFDPYSNAYWLTLGDLIDE